MPKTDTLPQIPIIFTLDKPYALRFTMRAIKGIEDVYGSMKAGLEALYNKDTSVSVKATITYLSILLELDSGIITGLLDYDKLIEARAKIPEVIISSFPDLDTDMDDSAYKKTDDPYAPSDWDWLYYIARYRLLMSDNEFWDIIPRRFHKLHYLYLVDNGIIKPEPEIYMGEMTY